MQISAEIKAQIAAAYGRMAETKYRPAAPSDGFGNITVPDAELDLDQEVTDYADRWWREEDAGGDYSIGTPDFSHRETLILAVEAARNCCGTDRSRVKPLLQAAIDALPAEA